ncbi:MAG: hypothetical protein IBX64_05265 [Actinobacteria bacterium]|nr:hypothetical protein [Actinomycetota bacterium]
MKKKWSLLAIMIIMIGVVGTAISAYALERLPINSLAPLFKAPIGVDEKQYNHDPEPRLKDNKGKVGQESKAKLEFHVPAEKLPEGVKRLEEKLLTWSEYQKSVNDKSKDREIADDREVWIVKTYYPQYNHVRFGTINDAIITRIYDAETGKYLGYDLTTKDPNELKNSSPMRDLSDLANAMGNSK